MVATNIWFWIGFIAFVLAMLALDLGVFNKRPHVVQPKEATIWTAVWVGLALLFAGGLAYFESHQTALTFLTGYLIEESLSIDNIFVIVLIFQYFAVPAQYQHRVLFWGILGALLMRGAMIGVGAQLIARFHWLLYVFGAFLIVAAIKMLLMKDGHDAPGENFAVRLTKRFFPVTDHFHGEHFVVRAGSGASHEAAQPGAAVVVEKMESRRRSGPRTATPSTSRQAFARRRNSSPSRSVAAKRSSSPTSRQCSRYRATRRTVA